MRIERLDPVADDSGVRAFWEVYEAANRLDTPLDPPRSLRGFRGHLTHGWSGEPSEAWLGWADERPRLIGAYHLTLPDVDNTHAGDLTLVVHPDLRRQGHGRELLEHAVGRARRAGRRLLMGEVVDTSPGPAFCAAVGAEQGLVELRRVLDLDAIDAEAHARLLDEARAAAAGYSLLRWAGATPEHHLDAFAALMARMSDAPTDALEWEQETWDAERVRNLDRGIEARGSRPYTVVARHDPTGTLAGLTMIVVADEHHGWAGQEDTVVLPEHRGHRLGLLMKLSMLPWLREEQPDVRRVRTWNAASNAHMIRVNELMGFRVLDRWASWQLRLTGRG